MDYRLYKQGHVVSDDSIFMEHKESRGVFMPEEVEALYPVNPVYGYPESDISKVMDLGVSATEREAILSRLKRMDSQYFPSGLSDDDILSLVPPRYFTDEVDVQRWRDYLSVYVLPGMEEAKKEALEKESGIATESAESTNSDTNNNKD